MGNEANKGSNAELAARQWLVPAQMKNLPPWGDLVSAYRRYPPRREPSQFTKHYRAENFNVSRFTAPSYNNNCL